MTVLIGDIHGNLKKLHKVLGDIDDDVLCVGDVGVGFSSVGQNPVLPDRFFFIRGNHDNPYWCKKHSKFVGDYGMWNGIFVLGGARSIDKERRTENIDWWRDEELSYADCQEALELYYDLKPRIVVSHDAPFSLQPEIKIAAVAKDPLVAGYGEPRPYATPMVMDEMFSVHQPDLWVMGHWHCKYQKDINGTRFRVLDIFEMINLEEELSKLPSNTHRKTGSSEVEDGKAN